MSSKQAFVNNILTFSCVDGPGNRLVIFFQGCNYQCQSCHNPYTIGICNDCGDCVEGCPQGALSLVNERIQWRSELCIRCDHCLDVCPISASPKTARYEASGLIGIIRENLPFISGITLSGGEPTTQLPFLIDFLAMLRADPDLHTLNCLVDSNGSLDQQGWEQLLPYIDGVMLDLKSWHPDRHVSLTGEHNGEVIKTLELLMTANKLNEVRLLVIPGQTDFEDHLGDLCSSLRQLPEGTPVRINAFQHHGVRGIAKDWENASQLQVEAFARQLKMEGVNNLILPNVYLENL